MPTIKEDTIFQAIDSSQCERMAIYMADQSRNLERLLVLFEVCYKYNIYDFKNHKWKCFPGMQISIHYRLGVPFLFSIITFCSYFHRNRSYCSNFRSSRCEHSVSACSQIVVDVVSG